MKTGLVFFTGFYTGWLLPAAVVGMMVFLYGVATMDMNQIALEVCNEGSKYEVSVFAFWLLKGSFMNDVMQVGGGGYAMFGHYV